MKPLKNSSIFIIIIFAFLFIFLLFATKPLAKEYHFTPEWIVNISNPTVKKVENKKIMYYRLGQTLGYMTSDGELTSNISFASMAAISDSYYALYNTNSTNLSFYFSNGEKAGTFETSGYPYFYKDLIFIFLPGGASFAKCKQSGEINWKYEGTIPITAFNTKDNFTCVGFANGVVKVFNNLNGNVEATFAPGGSDLPVILGCDVSNDGKYIATVSGHNKQRFVLAYKDSNKIKIIYHKFLDTDSPYQTLVRFCNDGKRVIYNYENAIGVYDFEKEENNTITINKNIISIKETDNLIILLGKEKSEYTVYFIDHTNSLEGSFTFNSENAFINTDETSIYIGKDNSISKITLEIK